MKTPARQSIAPQPVHRHTCPIRPMKTIRTLLAAALLTAPSLHAQAEQRCPRGEADDQGISVSISVAGHPTRVADEIDSVLVEEGWQILRSPQGTGRWQIAPSHTWPETMPERKDTRHPGVMLAVSAEVDGDSVAVSVGAQTLCSLGEAGNEATSTEGMLETLTAITTAGAIIARFDTLEANGVDLSAAVPGRQSVPMPERLGDFTLANRHDFDDPRLGTQLRFAGALGMTLDFYVYPGPPADSSCPTACAEQYVRAALDDFVGNFGEFIRRGYYRSMDVTGNEIVRPEEASDAWRVGGHLTMKVTNDEGQEESHMILYLFPGYQVKLRTTFAPSAERRAAMQRAMSAALTAFVPRD